jgi:hypothetical protein
MVGFTFDVSDLIFKYFNSASTYLKKFIDKQGLKIRLIGYILKIYIDAVYT